jgi:hypothetical protein
MHTDSLQRLRDQLETRRTRLLEADYEDFYPKIKRFWLFLHGHTVLKGLLAPLAERRPHVGHAVNLAMSGQPADDLCVASNDLDDAATAYNVLTQAVTFEHIYPNVQSHFSVEADPLTRIKSRLIQPLFDYLAETLDGQQVTLGCLLRYAQRCEWFDRDRLHELAAKHKQEAKGPGKRSKTEDLLKTDLYRYLHDQRIDFVIEPCSERGEIDLIVDQRGGQPTNVEVKVFDNEDKDRAYLQAGFHQLFTYLVQYKAAVGYLAVYRLCKEKLSFETDGVLQTVPFVYRDGKTIYLVEIDLFPYDKPVSQRGNLETVRVTKEQLVRQAGA